MTWNGANNIVVLDQGKSDVDSATYTTGSITLPATTNQDRSMFLFCTMVDGPGAATPVVPTWTRTTGGAAVTVTGVINDSSATADFRLSIGRLAPGEGGFTDSLIATSNATPDCFAWWILQIGNIQNGTASIVQTNSVVPASGTSNTLNLLAAVTKTSNLVIGMSTHVNGNATTVGQTRIGSEQTNAAPAFSTGVFYRNDGTATLSSSWTTAALSGLVMAEIRTVDEQVIVSNAVAT